MAVKSFDALPYLATLYLMRKLDYQFKTLRVSHSVEHRSLRISPSCKVPRMCFMNVLNKPGMICARTQVFKNCSNRKLLDH